MKVVIDTNVFVSSFLSPKGKPRGIIDLWKNGDITLCLCAEILGEYADVLQRLELEAEPEFNEVFEVFRSRVHIDFVVINNALAVIEEDPADDKFIECAVQSGASFIISGDLHLLRQKRYNTVLIVSPAEFLARHSSQRNSS